MASNIPNVVKCDLCGRLSPVLSWEPVYEELSPEESIGRQPRVEEFTCKYDCSKCGIRFQAMPPEPK